MKMVMKKTIILTALLGALVLVSYGQSVTLYNTNIVDVENGKIIPGMTVSVKDGIITKIAKAKKKIKRNQTDYTGAYLMPGLIDSHTHWGNFTMTPEYMRDMAESYIADGVTTVRDAGGDVRIVKRYEAKLDSGNILGRAEILRRESTPGYTGVRDCERTLESGNNGQYKFGTSGKNNYRS